MKTRDRFWKDALPFICPLGTLFLLLDMPDPCHNLPDTKY